MRVPVHVPSSVPVSLTPWLLPETFPLGACVSWSPSRCAVALRAHVVCWAPFVRVPMKQIPPVAIPEAVAESPFTTNVSEPDGGLLPTLKTIVMPLAPWDVTVMMPVSVYAAAGRPAGVSNIAVEDHVAWYVPANPAGA